MVKGKEISEIKKSPEYARLTIGQQKFCAHWIAQGDAVAAVRHAFNCKSHESARTFAYELLKNPRVKAVVNLRLGRTQTECLIIDLQQLITYARRKGSRLSLIVAPLLSCAAAIEKMNALQKAEG